MALGWIAKKRLVSHILTQYSFSAAAPPLDALL